MKAKRFLLHISILVLAVICMCAGVYVCYHELRGYYQNQEYYYNYEYEVDADEVLNYCNVERELREKYNDPKKVIIEDSKHGNVTVGDIEEIFIDKYQHYYKNGNYTNYNDFDDYMNSSYGNSGTLYEEDYNLMKTFRKKWKEDTTNKNNKEDYLYYKNKCKAVDEYANLIGDLLRGRCNYGGNIKLSDTNTLINKSYPLASDGFAYYVEYTLQGDKYTVSNVDDKNFFSLEGVVDVTKKEKNILVQDNPLYGTKELDKLGDDIREFIKNTNEIYFAIDTSMESNYTYYMERIKYQLTNEEVEQLKQREVICIITIIITLVIALILFIWLMFMAGHKEKKDKASLYKVDKLWIDIIIAILAIPVVCELAIFIDAIEGDYGNNVEKILIISLMILFLINVEVIVLLSESFMRRIKSKALMDTTLIGRIIKLIIKVIKRIKQILVKLWNNIQLTWKVVILGILFITFEMINSYLSYGYGLQGVIIQVPLITLLVCGLVWIFFDENKKIKDGAKKIAAGDIDYKIEEQMKFSVNKELKDSVNSIGNGLNSAILESIKNERMKTELIANVSHDLKTPLTSIINYVDLLKTEGLDSENAKKYLEVLDKKSQRLKNLTEDLVEVSKLNSGAVNLQLEKIDIVQLVNQSLGEYVEKFDERKLQIIKNIKQEPIYVMADGSKTWRLFENLYQNVYKYAMAGTRVYIEIKQEYGKAVVSVKNISETPLNFSADELMERFVRGDVSRTTEGSGLGLSIARSIAERQSGSMNIVLDGDLFKVEVMMNKIK